MGRARCHIVGGTWYVARLCSVDIRKPSGAIRSWKRVAMATGDVDVYAQALLPTPRETSSRNTRSECQTILAQLFTGPSPEMILSS